MKPLKLETLEGRPGWLRMVLRGEVPSKKNALLPRAGRNGKGTGFTYRADVRDAMQVLVDQARLIWIGAFGSGAPSPVGTNAKFELTFFVKNDRKDRDGMATTVIDVLKKAGVITDDAIKCFNGAVTLMPAMAHPGIDEHVVVDIYPL